MEEAESKTLLLDAYLKLNLVSAALAVILSTKIGLLWGAFVFLVLIHFSAAAVYLLDLESLKLGELIEKIFVTHLLASKLLKKDRFSGI
jgi:hypothetical protein